MVLTSTDQLWRADITYIRLQEKFNVPGRKSGAHSRRVMVSWDNAACESFMKTLKYEGVQPQRIPDLAEAKAAAGEFLEKASQPEKALLGDGLSTAGGV